MTTSFDAAVLGSGPAGLATAYRLATTGRSVVVVERAARVGGLAGSFDVGGVRVDHGSHRLHPSTAPEIMALLRALLGDDLQRRPRDGRIRLADRWVAFPPRAADLARRLPPSFVFGLTRDAVAGPFRRPRADTFAEVVRAGLGPTMAEGFYFPYVRKIWGVEPSALSGELARRRVGARSSIDVLRKLARSGRGKPDAGFFYYPKRGYGEIVDRLAAAAVDAGADLRLAAEVAGIDELGDSPRVQTTDGMKLEVHQVFSTLPLPMFARLVTPHPTTAVCDAAQSLTFRALTLAYLVLDRPQYTEFDAHYFPQLDVPFSRVSEPKNYRDGHDTDPAGRTVLCAELPCTVDDAIWRASATELGELVSERLTAQGLPRPQAVDVELRRVANAYPVYRMGFERDFDALDTWVGGLRNIVSLGRQGLFAHDNTHHAMAMGWAAADAVGRDGQLDAGRWSAARETFRSHVVED